MIRGQITYGLRDRNLVHISEVERGLACGCFCPCCKQQLIARKGQIIAHHFAHAREDCQGGAETALHLAAKEILSKAGYIVLPAVVPAFGNVRLAKESTFKIDKADLEHRLNSIVPDVVLHIKGKPLLIEITVTHGINMHKYSEIRRLGISTLEIDLSDIGSEWDLNELRSVVVDSSPRKKWVYNAYAERRPNFRKMVVIARGLALHVDGCPIPARVWRGKPYANIIDDCSCCEYLGEWAAYNKEYEAENPALSEIERRQLLESDEPNGVIYCAGHLAVSNQNNLKNTG